MKLFLRWEINLYLKYLSKKDLLTNIHLADTLDRVCRLDLDITVNEFRIGLGFLPHADATYRPSANRGLAYLRDTDIDYYSKDKLMAESLIGIETLTVSNGDQFSASEQFYVGVGTANVEQVTCSSVAGNVITLTAPLTKDHLVNSVVSTDQYPDNIIPYPAKQYYVSLGVGPFAIDD